MIKNHVMADKLTSWLSGRIANIIRHLVIVISKSKMANGCHVALPQGREGKVLMLEVYVDPLTSACALVM